MYQPYPFAGQGPVPQPSAPPRTLVTAVTFMYVGAALCAVWLIGFLARVSTLKGNLSALPAVNNTGTNMTPSQINTIVNAIILIYIVLSVIFAGLWIWMAWANRKGKIWARVVSTVFFGLFTLVMLLQLIRPQVSLIFVVTIISWLVGVVAPVLIWNSESSAYYQAMSGHWR